SLSTAPAFDSASGGHSAVVQSSSVNAAGNGTVTVVEENAAASGVAVLAVSGWTARYPGFPYIEWLSAAAGRQPAHTFPPARMVTISPGELRESFRRAPGGMNGLPAGGRRRRCTMPG